MKQKIFNEQALREDIIKTWGKAGAHIEVYDMLLKKAQAETYLLVSVNLPGFGGRMETEATFDNYRKYFNSVDDAKTFAELEYKGKIKWEKIEGGLCSGNLFFVLYKIKKISIEK